MRGREAHAAVRQYLDVRKISRGALRALDEFAGSSDGSGASAQRMRPDRVAHWPVFAERNTHYATGKRPVAIEPPVCRLRGTSLKVRRNRLTLMTRQNARIVYRRR